MTDLTEREIYIKILDNILNDEEANIGTFSTASLNDDGTITRCEYKLAIYKREETLFK